MYAFKENLSKLYKDPYDAYDDNTGLAKTWAVQQNLLISKNFISKNLCLVKDDIIFELPTKIISVKWALACVEKVEHICNKYKPDNKHTKICIKTANKWLNIYNIQDENEYNEDDIVAIAENIEEGSCNIDYNNDADAHVTEAATYLLYTISCNINATNVMGEHLDIEWFKENNYVYSAFYSSHCCALAFASDSFAINNNCSPDVWFNQDGVQLDDIHNDILDEIIQWQRNKLNEIVRPYLDLYKGLSNLITQEICQIIINYLGINKSKHGFL